MWCDKARTPSFPTLQVVFCTQALLGQRYGARAVPRSIVADDFDAIVNALRKHRNRDTRDLALLDLWYLKDTNVLPPVYSLVDFEKGKIAQDTYYEKHV